jgi:hypothetical protein
MKIALPFGSSQLLRLGLVATMATGVLATVAGHGTMAYFTTQTTSTANVFTAGTLHLQATDNNEGPLNSVTSTITFTGKMKPGDKVYAPIEIDNVGTLDAKFGIAYATTTTGTNLAPGLTLGIKRAGTGTAATIADCTGTNYADATVYQSTTRAAAAMVSAGETILAVGSGLPVVAGAHDILCMEVVFVDTGAAVNTYNNATNDATNTTVAFTFDGLVSASAVIQNP